MIVDTWNNYKLFHYEMSEHVISDHIVWRTFFHSDCNLCRLRFDLVENDFPHGIQIQDDEFSSTFSVSTWTLPTGFSPSSGSSWSICTCSMPSCVSSNSGSWNTIMQNECKDYRRRGNQNRDISVQAKCYYAPLLQIIHMSLIFNKRTKNGNGECVKETTTRPKSGKQPKATHGSSMNGEEVPHPVASLVLK